MADVIRKAIIEIETRQKKSRLDAPDVGQAQRSYKAEAEAATKAAESVDKATESTKRHAEVVRHSSLTMVRDFREAGEGVLRMTRGLTLLASSGSDDLKKLVQHVALAQGAFDVFAGGFKAFTNISKAFGGPAAAAITGVTAALGLGAVAWSRWKANAEAATAAAIEKVKAAEQKLTDFYASMDAGRTLTASEAQRGIGSALSPSEREARIREEIERQRTIGRIGLGDVSRFEGSNIVTSADRRQAIFGARDAARAAERQSELLQDLYQIQKEQIDTQRRGVSELLGLGNQGAAFGGAGVLSGFATASVNAAGGAFLGNFDQKTEQLTQQFQRMIDKLLKVAAEGIRKADALETGLQSAR